MGLQACVQPSCRWPLGLASATLLPGCSISSVLACRGRPFKQAAAAEAQATEGMQGMPESAWMGRLLMTVGCAVIS